LKVLPGSRVVDAGHAGRQSASTLTGKDASEESSAPAIKGTLALQRVLSAPNRTALWAQAAAG